MFLSSSLPFIGIDGITIWKENVRTRQGNYVTALAHIYITNRIFEEFSRYLEIFC